MRKKERFALALFVGGPALFGAALVAGCPADPRDAEPAAVVATVGDTKISRPALVAELSRAGVARLENEEHRRRLSRQVLERMVRQELLFQAATAAGITVDKHDVERELHKATEGYPPGMFQRVLHAEQLAFEQYEHRMLRRSVVDRYLKERFAKLPPPSDEDVRARWEATASAERPERVRARQILVKTEPEAQDLLAQIKKGSVTFEDAARRHSDAPEKDKGGDLGWFTRGQMPPVFDACFALEPGKTSDVVASEFGFHIFHVIDHQAAGKEPLEEARRRIEVELRQERQEQDLAAHAEELRKQARVTVSDEALEAAITQLPEGPFEEERGPDETAPAEGPTGGEAMPGAALKTSPRAKPLPVAPGAAR